MNFARWLSPAFALLVLGLSSWGFVALLQAVRSGQTQSWDDRILRSLRDADDPASPIGSRNVEHAARDITALGSIMVVILMTAATTGYFLLVQRRREALLLAATVVSGVIGYSLIKNLVARERPELWSPLVYSESHSFPSGHVTLATIFYFAIALLIGRYTTSVRVRAFVWGAAIGLVLLVALTRTYLGIHWPSDVVGGFLAGTAWTSLWWIMDWVFRPRSPLTTAVPAENPLAAPNNVSTDVVPELHQPES